MEVVDCQFLAVLGFRMDVLCAVGQIRRRHRIFQRLQHHIRNDRRQAVDVVVENRYSCSIRSCLDAKPDKVYVNRREGTGRRVKSRQAGSDE